VSIAGSIFSLLGILTYEKFFLWPTGGLSTFGVAHWP
jgi:hypothetical protein